MVKSAFASVRRSRPAKAPRGRVVSRGTPAYKVQVLERAFTLLDCFTVDQPERGVSELSRAVPLHKATVHRLLSVLERWGYVEQVQDAGRYRLGLKLVELGSRALQALGLTQVAKPELEKLAAETDETAHLMVMDGDEGLYLEKVESRRSFRMPSQVGRRISLHCTGVGKALLAFLPAERVEQVAKARGLPKMTPHTIVSVARLKAELADIRRRGYAVDREEAELGLRCIAAPIFGPSGEVVASISIAGPAVRVSPENEKTLAKDVVATAQRISKRLGYSAPVNGEHSTRAAS